MADVWNSVDGIELGVGQLGCLGKTIAAPGLSLFETSGRTAAGGGAMLEDVFSNLAGGDCLSTTIGLVLASTSYDTPEDYQGVRFRSPQTAISKDYIKTSGDDSVAINLCEVSIHQLDWDFFIYDESSENCFVRISSNPSDSFGDPRHFNHCKYTIIKCDEPVNGSNPHYTGQKVSSSEADGDVINCTEGLFLLGVKTYDLKEAMKIEVLETLNRAPIESVHTEIDYQSGKRHLGLVGSVQCLNHDGAIDPSADPINGLHYLNSGKNEEGSLEDVENAVID